MAEHDDKGEGGTVEDGAAESESKTGSEGGSEHPRPADAFKQGMGLLWQAARSAAEEIKREVAKGSVSGALQQAGRDLEQAATQAARALEGIIGRLGPGDPPTAAWPKGAEENVPPAAEQQEDGQAPADGGTTESGERRDMRIQIEPGDKPK